MKKYFIPNEHNEYVPHFFRTSTVAIFSFIAVIVFLAGVFHISIIRHTDFLSAVIPKVIVDLTNANRATSNLGALATSPILEDAAQRKANHMAEYGYFAHNSPDGVTPWYWFKQAGYEYLYAGENLAVNFSDSVDVDKAWMNSPSHKANIMNGRFTEIGVATARGTYKGKDTVFVVQMFGRPLPSFAKKILELRKQEEAGIRTASTTGSATIPVKTASSTIVNPPMPRVLGDSGSFISTMNEEVGPDLTEEILAQENGEKVAKEEVQNPVLLLASSPKGIVETVYITLLSLISLALLLFIGIEIKRQSPKYVILGVTLLMFVLTLFYLYMRYFVSTVEVM